MRCTDTVQVIERNGKPEWAVIPYEEYIQLVEHAEMLEDIRDFDQIITAIDNGTEEVVPTELVDAILSGKNLVKVWREYRQMTQRQVADTVGISIPYLSQIGAGKRKASTDVMKKIAQTLRVSLDDLP